MHRFTLRWSRSVLMSLGCGLAVGCATQPTELPPLPPTGSGQFLAVATSDFLSGALHSIELSTLKVRRDIDVVDAQPVVRAYGSKVYVLDQTHGTARAYDTAQDFVGPTELLLAKSPEVPAPQANPYDLYIDGATSKAYVTLYGGFGSTAVTGSTALGVVDLNQPTAGIASFIPLPVAAGDTDNNPDATRLHACGDVLYVLLQDLDRSTYRSVGPGRLAKVSLREQRVLSTIQLAGENPTALSVLPGCSEAIIGSAGDQLSGSLSGRSGVERVDLVNERSLGLTLRDSDLGGNVSTLEAASGRDVFVDVSRRVGMNYENDVYLLDAVSGVRSQRLLGPMRYVPSLRVVGQRLIVLSAGSAGNGQLPPGLYIGPANGDALPTTPIDLGLAPISTDLYAR